MTSIQTHRSHRRLTFPEPPQPDGASVARLCPTDNGEPLDFLMKDAVGDVAFGIEDEKFMLTIDEAIPGQVAALLEAVDQDVFRRLEIRSGALSRRDLVAIGASWVNDLRLGTPRTGLAQPERANLTFVDGPDLSALSGLQELHIDYVPFSDQNLKTLGSKMLSSLSLGGVRFTWLFRLGNLKHLNSLHLEGDEVGHDMSMLRFVRKLRTLDVRFSGLTEDQLVYLAECEDLRVLDIAYNAELGADLSALASRPELVYLDISTTGADDSTLESIETLGALQHLNAQCTAITDDGLFPLIHRTDLARLNLAGNRITDDGLERIVVSCPHLASLDLRATDVTTEGLWKLLPKLPNLRTLGAAGDLLSAELAEHLLEHTKINFLKICPPMETEGWADAVDWIGAATLGGPPA